MRRLRRHPLLVLWLTLVWVGLWGTVTPANVLGGLAVALVLVALLPLNEVESHGVVRPVALLRFLAYFAGDLLKASLQVAVLVVHPRRELRQAVIAVPVRGQSDRLLTLLANAISLTPGTLTLEVDRPGSVLYVHALVLDRGPGAIDALRGDILRVERLAVLAVGSPEARRVLDEQMQDSTEVPQ